MKTLTAAELKSIEIIQEETRSRYNWQLLGNGQTHVLTIGEDIPTNVKGWKGTAATALRALDPPVRPIWGKIPGNESVITMRCEPIELPSTFVPSTTQPPANNAKKRQRNANAANVKKSSGNSRRKKS